MALTEIEAYNKLLETVKKNYEMEKIQDKLYTTLAKANINPITARYIAMRLQELDATQISNIKQIETYKYSVTTNLKNYVIELHQLGLPDAKILEVT